MSAQQIVVAMELLESKVAELYPGKKLTFVCVNDKAQAVFEVSDAEQES